MADVEDHSFLFSWTQEAQVKTGAWVRPDGFAAALVACAELLDRVPGAYTERELGILAVVLAGFSQRLVRDASVLRVQHESRDPLVHIGAGYRHADFHLGALAHRLNRSRWHSCRIIRLATGYTFSKLLHTMRVCAAIDLLLGTVLSVKEIANSVGYQSTAELDRQFRRYLHASPVSFRRAFDRAPAPQPLSLLSATH